MEKLNKDWITEKHIDFEYKKYVLLAYLKHVDGCFRATRLYPALADLVEHYRLARLLKENKESLAAHFPKRLSGFDSEKFVLTYDSLLSDDRLMAEVESILDYSLPKFEEWLREGKHIYDFIEKEIELGTVGLVPIDTGAGYLFLKNATAHTRVYMYSITIFEEPDATWRGVHTSYLRTYRQNIMQTYESIKNALVRENRQLPNPAVFVAETGLDIPVEETFLPIAKRMLVREVSL
ncbi:MAG TPA: hypothetical protein VI731_00540, partial [Bacteroidia bacterium]|nr:hypothetical protein [Bacteroidia bacterium]